MCLIIAQNRGATIVPDDHIIEAWEQNPDGGGIAFVEGGKVVIRKAMTLAYMLEMYRNAHNAVGEYSPVLLHFRWATHGSNGKINTHPHRTARGRVALVHNGIIDIDIPKGADISDTVAFARTLNGTPPATLVSKRTLRKLARRIGGGNKLALLTDSGVMRIVNEEAGHWDDDVERTTWYSNGSYLPNRWAYLEDGTYSDGTYTPGVGKFGAPAISGAPRSLYGADGEGQSQKAIYDASHGLLPNGTPVDDATMDAEDLITAAWDAHAIEWMTTDIPDDEAPTLWWDAEASSWFVEWRDGNMDALPFEPAAWPWPLRNEPAHVRSM